MFIHRHSWERQFLCTVDKEEETLGPGGVPTPTPEPGPTPTPQPEPEIVAGDEKKGELKPLAALLGKKDGEVTEPEPKPAAKSEPAARINTLTKEKWDEKRRADAAEARAKLAEDTIAELQKLNVTPPKEGEVTPPKPTARTFTAADVEAEARRLAAQTTFNQRVDEAVISGRASHKDYDEAINSLKAVTGPIVPGDFLAAALETGEASEVIYHLGKNPGEADRILSLPVISQAVALAQLASEIKSERAAAAAALEAKGPSVSRAPKPIVPKVGGGSSVEPDLETMPMADFIKSRNESERAAARR